MRLGKIGIFKKLRRVQVFLNKFEHGIAV